MDIFNRPPAISEDRLQYALYPPPGQQDKTAVSSLAAVLQAHVDSLLPEFIWHRDTFQLKVARDLDAGDQDWMLEGTMRVGDCVDDEWCVVWLLKEITKRWDVVVSVWDTDGEFLLIEAADDLPSWVTPTNAENRVWVYAFHLHLIPLTHVSPPSSKRRRRRYGYTQDSDEEAGLSDNDDYLSIYDALKLVRSSEIATQGSAKVEEATWRRTDRYPGALKEHVHMTKAWLPHAVAKALSVNPALTQKPVETFYTRDAIQLRAAHKMARFPPEPAVLRSVRLTRTAYAQLLGQKFHPPKIFGRWSEREGTDEWRYRDVGMKIACGFEMLYQESKNRNEGISTSDQIQSMAAQKDALRRNPDYNKYIDSLKTAGYFKGEIEGSELWNKLDNRAASVFIESRQDDDASRPSFATLVQHAITCASDEALQTFTGTEDSDDWLNVDAADFDDMLARTMGTTGKGTASRSAGVDAMDVDSSNGAMAGEEEEEASAKDQAARLRQLAEKVGKFVEGKGTVEGATFAGEGSDTDEDDDKALSEFSDEQFSDSDDESVDEDRPTPAAAAASRKEAMDNLVAPLAPEEYGKMPPSFHENSQRVGDAADEDQEEVEEQAITRSGLGGIDEYSKKEDAPFSMRPPILPRDKYEGVDSDDESDSDEDGGVGRNDLGSMKIGPLPSDEEDSDEDRPQVVGDIEIDMGEEEAEFLEFSRKALGISDKQWNEIIEERKERGAFVPTAVSGEGNNKKKTAASDEVASTGAPPSDHKPRMPQTGPRPNVNPNLDSFEAVMEAMEAELTKQKKPTSEPSKATSPGKAKAPAPTATSTSTQTAKLNQKKPANKDAKGKGKEKAKVSFAEDVNMGGEDSDIDIEAAMDAELKAALQSGDLDVDSDEEGDGLGGEGGMDYNLIKNFLESFKSQGGLAGPVGNLAGRLQGGWTLPRDDA